MLYSAVLRKLKKHKNAVDEAIKELRDVQHKIDYRRIADDCNNSLISSLDSLKATSKELEKAIDSCPKSNNLL